MFERIRRRLLMFFHFGFIRDKKIAFIFEGRNLLSGQDTFIKSNRYYLPLDKTMNKLNGQVRLKKNTISLWFYNKEFVSDFENVKYFYKGGTIYISLFDITKILGLRTRWNYERREIRLFRDSDMEIKAVSPAKGSIALIRFEDITAGPPLTSPENLEKLRIISDYLYLKSIPFHAAWIPRYVDPHQKIDNDVSYTYSIGNADFVFTLDHMIWRGCLIGIHGYTHQCGMEVTAVGTEFNNKCNNDEKSVRRRIELAICTAKRLNFPILFFESPHYASTKFQQSIMEQYFNYIYEPYVGIWGDRVVISPRNKRTLYVPTPLGYISENNTVDDMVSKIKHLPKDIIASFFYHPLLELNYITLHTGERGYPLRSYSKISTLHKIVDALLQNGRIPIKITDCIRET